MTSANCRLRIWRNERVYVLSPETCLTEEMGLRRLSKNLEICDVELWASVACSRRLAIIMQKYQTYSDISVLNFVQFYFNFDFLLEIFFNKSNMTNEQLVAGDLRTSWSSVACFDLAVSPRLPKGSRDAVLRSGISRNGAERERERGTERGREKREERLA